MRHPQESQSASAAAFDIQDSLAVISAAWSLEWRQFLFINDRGLRQHPCMRVLICARSLAPTAAVFEHAAAFLHLFQSRWHLIHSALRHEWATH
jgi:hypothetical protein